MICLAYTLSLKRPSWLATAARLGLCLSVIGLSAQAQSQIQTDNTAVYDSDAGVWLEDSDGDGYPDVREEALGSDPRDRASYPYAELHPSEQDLEMEEANAGDGFVFTSCQPSFVAISNRLCAENAPNPATRYDHASSSCRSKYARVCTYEDLFYIFTAPNIAIETWGATGRWIGQLVGDNTALAINRTVDHPGDENIADFEGTANKEGSRSYFCCHDRLGPQQARCPRLNP